MKRMRGSAGDLAEALTTPFANAQVDLDAVLRVFGDNEIHHVAFAKNLSLDWLRASLGDRIATVVWSALHPPVGAECAPMRHSHRRVMARARARVPITHRRLFTGHLHLRASKAIAPPVGVGTKRQLHGRSRRCFTRGLRVDRARDCARFGLLW